MISGDVNGSRVPERYFENLRLPSLTLPLFADVVLKSHEGSQMKYGHDRSLEALESNVNAGRNANKGWREKMSVDDETKEIGLGSWKRSSPVTRNKSLSAGWQSFGMV